MSEESLQRELECYRKRYSELEAKNAELEKQVSKLASENRALRSSVVIRKIMYGNQSDEGARAHAILMSIRETCTLRKENFFDYAMQQQNPTSER